MIDGLLYDPRPVFDVVVNPTTPREQVQAADPLLNPYISGKATLFDKEFELAALSEEELRTLTLEFGTLISNRRSNYGLMLLDNSNAVLAGVRAAKKKISGSPVFRGSMASSNELGMQLLRPGHIRRVNDNATETADNTWEFTATKSTTAASNQSWLGYGAADYNTALSIDKRALMVVMGIVGYGSTCPFSEIQIKQGMTDYVVETLEPFLYNADSPEQIPISRIRTRILPPRETLLAKIRSRMAGTYEVGLVGVAIGTGAYMKADYYAAPES